MCFGGNKVLLYSYVVLFLVTAVRSSSDDALVSNTSSTGYGYEVLLAKLEYLQHKLIEMDFAMKEVVREVVSQKQTHQEALSDGLLRAFNQMSHNLTVLQTQSMKILSQQTACASHEQMRKEIQQLAPKEGIAGLKTLKLFGTHGSVSNHQNVTFRSCKDEPSKRSGKYSIQPSENHELFMVYCEQTRFGGGWLVFQFRFNGSLDLNRNWSAYREGFGSLDGEFWLGLEHLHQLTTARPHELLVEVEDFSGNYSYARYKEFEIGSEAEHYALKKLGAYTGTAGDSLTYHKGMKFSTFDRDNDAWDGNCAVSHMGAWWYKGCHYSNLNGAYKNDEKEKAINWYTHSQSYASLAYSRMMIREV